MSDPVSNHDIEDVLSSIRKLVAQGNHDVKRQGDEPEVRRSDAFGGERLVLTPAFRVRETSADSPKPDALQTPPQFAPAKTQPVETTVIIDLEDDGEKVDRASLEATIAELEAAVTQTSDEWEPDGSEMMAETSVTSAFLHKLDARQSQGPETVVSDAVAEHIAETIAEEIAENLSNDMEATGDQPEAEIVDAPDTDEVAFSHKRFDEVYDPVAEATADAAEAVDGDIYGDELAPDDVDPTFGAVATPPNAQLVDPDALRAMVGEMIRHELQGEMGERITRNVRKLVRREINRVITEQEV